MAAGWTVTPNQGVTGTGPTFTFPENTGTTAIVYTIKYEDADGCTASTTYTVLTGETCQPCTCDNFEWDETTQKTISSDGGNLTISHTNGCVTPSIKYYNGSTETTKPSWITNVTNNNNNTVFTIANNTGDERTVSVSMIVDNTECKRYTITQYEQYTPKIHLDAKLTFQGLVRGDSSGDNIFNVLQIHVSIKHIPTGEIVLLATNIGNVSCCCTASCPDCSREQFVYKTSLSELGGISFYNDDTNYANYELTLTRANAIARDRDMTAPNASCGYEFSDMEEMDNPKTFVEQPDGSRYIATLDKLKNNEDHLFMIYFNGR